MDAILHQHATTARAAILDLLDGLDAARLLSDAGVSAAEIAALRSRLFRP